MCKPFLFHHKSRDPSTVVSAVSYILPIGIPKLPHFLKCSLTEYGSARSFCLLDTPILFKGCDTLFSPSFQKKAAMSSKAFDDD